MKKYIVAATAALTIAVPAVITTAAQAAPSTLTQAVQQVVQRGYNREVRNRLQVSGKQGISIDTVKVRCANDGGSYFSCYARTTTTEGRTHFLYGVQITARTTGGGGVSWKAGNATTLNSW